MKSVKEIRDNLNVSQSELARLIHVRQATISDVENGKFKPSPLLSLILRLLDKGILTKEILESVPGAKTP